MVLVETNEPHLLSADAAQGRIASDGGETTHWKMTVKCTEDKRGDKVPSLGEGDEGTFALDEVQLSDLASLSQSLDEVSGEVEGCR